MAHGIGCVRVRSHVPNQIPDLGDTRCGLIGDLVEHGAVYAIMARGRSAMIRVDKPWPLAPGEQPTTLPQRQIEAFLSEDGAVFLVVERERPDMWFGIRVRTAETVGPSDVMPPDELADYLGTSAHGQVAVMLLATLACNLWSEWAHATRERGGTPAGINHIDPEQEPA